MPDCRLRFKKDGTARFISHLDLMRTFQRAFQRAGIQVGHTHGFNPHPVMSVALPLPLGFTGGCELLDFETEELPDIERLNAVLPSGMEILEAYRPERPFKELVYCEYDIYMRYGAVCEETAEMVGALLKTKPLTVMKKTKSGEADADISASIISHVITPAQDGLTLSCVLTAKEPYLNPQYLLAAIKAYKSELLPEYSGYHRKSVLDKDMNIFR